MRVPGTWGSQILRQSAHEGGKVVNPTHRPPLLPGNIPGTHFCERLSQSQGHSAAGRIKSMKNSNDTIGNESATFRLVAQCLNQLRHRVPPASNIHFNIILVFIPRSSSWRRHNCSSNKPRFDQLIIFNIYGSSLLFSFPYSGILFYTGWAKNSYTLIIYILYTVYLLLAHLVYR
jgi:hypothetical protein